MSIDALKIVCTGCDYEGSEVFRPIRIIYEETSGKTIDSTSAKGWCYNCQSYTDIEKINYNELNDELCLKELQAVEIQKKIQLLKIGLFSIFKNIRDKRNAKLELQLLGNEIEHIKCLLKISETRKAGARCLKCWSDNTVPLHFDTESRLAYGFTHQCGGKLKIVSYDYEIRYHFKVTTYFLSVEGELIREEMS